MGRKKSVSLIVHTYMENSIKGEGLKTLFWCLFFSLNQCSILLKGGKEREREKKKKPSWELDNLTTSLYV